MTFVVNFLSSKKNENVRLRVSVEQRLEKALVVADILDAVLNLMGGVNNVRTVGCNMDMVVTRPEQCFLD